MVACGQDAPSTSVETLHHIPRHLHLSFSSRYLMQFDSTLQNVVSLQLIETDSEMNELLTLYGYLS